MKGEAPSTPCSCHQVVLSRQSPKAWIETSETVAKMDPLTCYTGCLMHRVTVTHANTVPLLQVTSIGQGVSLAVIYIALSLQGTMITLQGLAPHIEMQTFQAC